MTDEVTLRSPITMLTLVNLCLGIFYYIVAIFLLELSSYQLPYVIEVPVTIAFSIFPLYLVAHKAEIGFFDDIDLYSLKQNRKSSGTAMKVFGYLSGYFVLFMWMGRIYCEILEKCS